MKFPFTLFQPAADEHLHDLKGLSLFKTLTVRELREVDELVHERVYQKDEVVFDEGDVGLGLFIIISGRVKVMSSHARPEQLPPELSRGDFFGEIALFDEGPRSARVVAIEPTRLLALFRTEFFSLLERDRRVGVKILLELSRSVVLRSRRLFAGQLPPLP